MKTTAQRTAFVSLLLLACAGVFAAETPRSGPSVDFSHGPLQLSENGHFLQHEDGTPFFYLGDTTWELFHRTTLKEAETYLENRRQKGFTVVQAVVLSEFNGLTVPNANGDLPLIDADPGRPNDPYFQYIDEVVRIAEAKGIVVGILPTWGDKVTKQWGVGPVIFEATQPEKMESYGQYLGDRYKNHPNILWILGGDRTPQTGVEIWDALAKGIKEGEEGGITHVMTYHPSGGSSSAAWFHGKDWLSFNMIQSGHAARNQKNYEMIAQNYALTPAKPTIDGEPNYEDHPVNWKAENGYFDDYDVRKLAYWSVFAGSAGHTYGCNDVWQFWTPDRGPLTGARTHWTEAMDLPGAWDMLLLRRLIESRPYYDRTPDPSLIAAGQGEGGEHVEACRGKNYAFVYISAGQKVTVRMGKISGETVKAAWFDPRTGEALGLGSYENSGTQEFVPPDSPKDKNDWVLVLDSSDKNFSAPGAE